MFNYYKFALLMFLTAFMVGCSATQMSVYSVDKKETLCQNNSVNLGHIVILPEVAWRSDQKEPNKRKEMALKEIKSVFNNISCAQISKNKDIKGFSAWSSMSESKLIDMFSNQNVDTIIIVRIEELTPRIEITFSLPFLWKGSNEADFHIKVISLKDGKILNNMRIKRVTGGAFNIRPAEWSKDELNAALQSIIN